MKTVCENSIRQTANNSILKWSWSCFYTRWRWAVCSVFTRPPSIAVIMLSVAEVVASTVFWRVFAKLADLILWHPDYASALISMQIDCLLCDVWFMVIRTDAKIQSLFLFFWPPFPLNDKSGKWWCTDERKHLNTNLDNQLLSNRTRCGVQQATCSNNAALATAVWLL